jgi:ubiquinone/menaquinone biosynthesis C-methylase UbiE
MTSSVDTAFTRSVAQLYESHLVPLIFEPYAVDLARRVAALQPRRVLEIAAGTGAVTRQLAVMLPPASEIVATDLNPSMLDEGQRIGTTRRVEWRVADAMDLPFEEGAFDAVACQFGAMFFPDRPHAYRQVLRVLEPGGAFHFNVWDTLESNELADAVTAAMVTLFPQDPPRFLARTPHGYHDASRIRQDLAAAGFTGAAKVETVAFTSRAATADIAAIAYCQGTPLRGEIVARDPDGLAAATQAASAEIARRFGPGPVDTQIRALVVSASC